MLFRSLTGLLASGTTMDAQKMATLCLDIADAMVAEWDRRHAEPARADLPLPPPRPAKTEKRGTNWDRDKP